MSNILSGKWRRCGPLSARKRDQLSCKCLSPVSGFVNFKPSTIIQVAKRLLHYPPPIEDFSKAQQDQRVLTICQTFSVGIGAVPPDFRLRVGHVSGTSSDPTGYEPYDGPTSAFSTHSKVVCGPRLLTNHRLPLLKLFYLLKLFPPRYQVAKRFLHNPPPIEDFSKAQQDQRVLVAATLLADAAAVRDRCTLSLAHCMSHSLTRTISLALSLSHSLSLTHTYSLAHSHSLSRRHASR